MVGQAFEVDLVAGGMREPACKARPVRDEKRDVVEAGVTVGRPRAGVVHQHPRPPVRPLGQADSDRAGEQAAGLVGECLPAVRAVTGLLRNRRLHVGNAVLVGRGD